jgi:hypothetical protein
MITKYRNWGILQLICALALTVAVVIVFRGRGLNISDNRTIILIILYLAAVTLWMVGSFSLAKAKGYGSDTMGGIFLFLFLLGFCIPIAPFVFPGFVIFGLKDKMKRRSRRDSEKR